ncbi:ATP-binding protein [Nitrospira defluvii]|nr:ATP-binding protein [Nitrospira defluvii]
MSVLKNGKIEIHIGRVQEKNDDFIYIKIKDNGNGFDYHPYLSGNVDNMKEIYGRGIKLVRELSKEIKYLGGGCEVQVIYSLSLFEKNK